MGRFWVLYTYQAMVLEKPKGERMIMNNQKERTVFYVRQNQDGKWADVYCLDSKAEAKKWIAKNNIENAQVLEVQSSTHYPEMVNKRFKQVSKPQEKVTKPKMELVYKYKIMFQDEFCKVGWLDSFAEKLVPKECEFFGNESHACDVADRLWGEGLLTDYKIKRIGFFA